LGCSELNGSELNCSEKEFAAERPPQEVPAIHDAGRHLNLIVSFLSYPSLNESFRTACDRAERSGPPVCAASQKAGLV
jgi:hypothetical protein